MSAGFLEQMGRAGAERVAIARARISEEELRERAYALPAPPPLVLHPQGFDLIAEVKFRSPAAGRLVAPADERTLDEVTARACEYAQAGAAAVSVLTEPTRFDGSLEHLRAATGALRELGVPVMRKDFLVDPYQVLEARVAGAAGVLIVLRMLTDPVVESLLRRARELGLFVLLEAFDEADIERTHAWVNSHGSGAGLLVGLNCRDLDTLQVVPDRLESLAPRLPANVPRVAESGVASVADAARLAAAGYDLALVGTALMTEGSPSALARNLLAAGRAAKAHRS
ncbi:MAG TPA: indole-3-glycerol-phosphate synthase [Steroidobacteraceae bacterium]|nr:indole-3-glycerol-phosphate synthase [Steroidobacteraceae bacterium]